MLVITVALIIKALIVVALTEVVVVVAAILFYSASFSFIVACSCSSRGIASYVVCADC